jgi:hypothetical protein
MNGRGKQVGDISYQHRKGKLLRKLFGRANMATSVFQSGIVLNNYQITVLSPRPYSVDCCETERA